MWHTDDPRKACQPGTRIVIHSDDAGAQVADVREGGELMLGGGAFRGAWPSSWVWLPAPLGPLARAAVAEASLLLNAVVSGEVVPLEDLRRVNRELTDALPEMHQFFIRWNFHCGGLV